jgi:hypothetical protein
MFTEELLGEEVFNTSVGSSDEMPNSSDEELSAICGVS